MHPGQSAGRKWLAHDSDQHRGEPGRDGHADEHRGREQQPGRPEPGQQPGHRGRHGGDAYPDANNHPDEHPDEYAHPDADAYEYADDHADDHADADRNAIAAWRWIPCLVEVRRVVRTQPAAAPCRRVMPVLTVRTHAAPRLCGDR